MDVDSLNDKSLGYKKAFLWKKALKCNYDHLNYPVFWSEFIHNYCSVFQIMLIIKCVDTQYSFMFASLLWMLSSYLLYTYTIT